MTRLGPAAPASPPRRPEEIGIVHLGLGAFHRAHQAVFTEDAMRASGRWDWGIVGVTQRSDRVLRQLAPQENLYTVVERGEGAAAPRVVGALRGVLNGNAEPESVLDWLARPSVRVVTLTVTEKGYRHDAASGELDLTDPEVAADLTGRTPKTVVGQLVGGLRRRMTGGGGPITLVCCDNLPSNGRFLHRLVTRFCAAAGLAEVSDWIERNVRFPSTMVDRIVPPTTEADIAEVAGELGYTDEGLVVAEPFAQWVIEDDFAAGRPAWERAGAVLTSDVEAWERLKLRVLNGSHSLLAYFGLLAGHAHIADAVADPVLRTACEAMIADDVLPVLRPPAGVDVLGYRQTTLTRFANRALRHTTAQVAMDGSQKLGPRLLTTVADARAAGHTPRWIPWVLAAWMRHVLDPRDATGKPVELRDPLAAELTSAAAGARSPREQAARLLGMRRVFPGDLDPVLAERVLTAHETLATGDLRAALKDNAF